MQSNPSQAPILERAQWQHRFPLAPIAAKARLTLGDQPPLHDAGRLGQVPAQRLVQVLLVRFRPDVDFRADDEGAVGKAHLALAVVTASRVIAYDRTRRIARQLVIAAWQASRPAVIEPAAMMEASMIITDPLAPLVAKADFLHVPEVAHLCAGGETAILRSHRDAVQRFFEGKSAGMAGRMEQSMGLLERTRERAARLFGVPVGDMAFLSSATDGINHVANGLDWQPGDNIVVEDIEFPSGIYPWTRLAQREVEVRVVRQWGDDASIDRLADAVDRRTRVVATSQVSYLTGRRYDLEQLAAIAHEAGALLSIDATHAAGVLPVVAHHADIVVSSCYKFLLGVHGAALFYCNPTRLADLPPQQLGWNSAATARGVQDPTNFIPRDDARRFEAGNPPFLALAVLDHALAYIAEIGVERIEQHVLALGQLVWDALEQRGIRPLTPRDPQRRGPNVAFLWPDPAKLTAQLAERGVLIWGDSGRVRVSFHAYNDQADIERFLAALDDVMQTGPTM